MSSQTVFMSLTDIPLEDGVADIIGKAARGLKLSWQEIAERAEVDENTLGAIRSGNYSDTDALKRLAFVLHLDSDALAQQAGGLWYPNFQAAFPGVAMFTTPLPDMTVNAFLVWDPVTRQAASFDTGSSCQPMLAQLAAEGLTLQKIFITHTHADHLMDLETLHKSAPQAKAYGSAAENPLGLLPLVPGDRFQLGALQIGVLGTAGHTPGGLSYFITGLKTPVVITGDALFAGSIGGAAYAYEEARRNIRQHLFTLPDETILCPGHGPCSTLGEEKAHNPFFPEIRQEAMGAR